MKLTSIGDLQKCEEENATPYALGVQLLSSLDGADMLYSTSVTPWASACHLVECLESYNFINEMLQGVKQNQHSRFLKAPNSAEWKSNGCQLLRGGNDNTNGHRCASVPQLTLMLL